jgi:predicted acetyltransferase
MSVALKELTTERDADYLWFDGAYRLWLQELGGSSSHVAASHFASPALSAQDGLRIFLIQRQGRSAGFAVVEFVALAPSSRARRVTSGSDYRLLDFYVEPEVRRLGVGFEAARLLFLRFRGAWEVSALDSDSRAIRFWRSVVTRAIGGGFSEARCLGRWSQHFCS